jgi:hypothetical protein
MSNRVYEKTMLIPPVAKAIPYGQFFDIDQKYYEQQPANETKDRHLRPHGMNVNLKHSDGFVAPETPLSLDSGTLKVNYGSYLYQQRTGFTPAHPADEKTPATVVLFM